MKTAMCYRADGSLKWATWLPDRSDIPPTTIYDGETLWPHVEWGKEENGKSFFVPVGKPIKGPVVTE